MSIQVALHHRSHYRYDRAVSLAPQTIRLRPAPYCQTPINAYSLKISPSNHFIHWQQDLFGNYLANVVFPEPTRELIIDIDLVAMIQSFNPLDFFLDEATKEYPFQYVAELSDELFPYLQYKEQHPWIAQWVTQLSTQKMHTIDLLAAINQEVHKSVHYVIRMEPGVQSVAQTLESCTGSCRDMAWLLVQFARALGLASRFVSGYLIQLKPDEAPTDGRPALNEDVTDLHAWTEVYLPGAGWVGLDPTSGLFASEGHIPLCASPDPQHAAPLSGLLDPCESTLTVDMTLTRINEGTRVTQPYTSQQWQQIQSFGQLVDDKLLALQVALTMGGEPTFLNHTHQDLPEWQTAALGEEKWQLAHQLRELLCSDWSPNGLMRTGQGKWYSGEALPRWALNCYWRADSEPMWTRPDLLAKVTAQHDATMAHAAEFIQECALHLGVAPTYILPVYQAGDSKTSDSDAGSTGFVLPLAFSATEQCWVSQHWQFVDDTLIALPGDSPLGYRLPLQEIVHDDTVLPDIDHPRSPFAEFPALPTYQTFATLIRQRYQRASTLQTFAPIVPWAIKLALSIEVRDQTLYVFMPPVSYLEHYLDLVSTIELVAAQLNCPIVIEGYAPPNDPRLHQFSITPDPGVIEVNVAPVTNWQDLVTRTETLFERAKQCGLIAEKFLLDGRIVGTGGGNHITVGGENALASPLLRRPDVLRSFITYWQHHPSLSYLFAGLFVGPTSQAPRIDEARHDALYELEIALAHFEQQPKAISPWLVDRLLRNLLVDITGNTHRAEFCVDKLYSPHSETGRLGLLELRAFEMPAHPQLYAAQMLLIRTFFAYFWEHAYHKRFIRFGTELHDRYLLPHFLWNDFIHVLEDLQHSDYAIQSAWYLPFFEFRFPCYGQVQIGDINLELRMALEPWHVLGEENNSGNISRTVDCATERLQVKITGLTKERYILACNGRYVPLHPTGQHGEYIAGVRFKAWSPTFTLHPHIKEHTPLVFDLIDTHHERAIGGCTYHAHHPGGRNYTEAPVNREEAQARQRSHFKPFGHTPGQLVIPKPFVHPECPYTLDLRYPGLL